MTAGGRVETLGHGVWISGYLSGHVWIVRQDWDHFHEDFYDEGPQLDSDGWAYYALYGTTPDIAQNSSRSPTCFSLADAVAEAEAKLASVRWD